MRASGALWIESVRTLAVADLHFEKGSSFASRGQLLPPYDTGETLRRLEVEVAALSPRILVFLGDSFHDGRAEGRLAARDAIRLAELARGRTLIWVVGNHDADGPRVLPGEVAEDLMVEGLLLRHEPRPGLQPGETAGHLHPSARIVARGTLRPQTVFHHRRRTGDPAGFRRLCRGSERARCRLQGNVRANPHRRRPRRRPRPCGGLDVGGRGIAPIETPKSSEASTSSA